MRDVALRIFVIVWGIRAGRIWGLDRIAIFQSRDEIREEVRWIKSRASGVLIGIILRRIRVSVFRHEVAVRGVGFVVGVGELFGAEDVASGFESFVGLAFDAFGIVFVTEFAGGVVAIFLEELEVAGDAAEIGNGAGEFFGIGGELLLGLGIEEEFAELGGSELETDFREMGGVGGAEVIGEVILAEAFGDDAFLFETPFVVAAASFPVGDVAFGDADAVFTESFDNVLMGNVVLKHEIDHVAKGLGEAGDFAVAAEFAGGFGNRSGSDTGQTLVRQRRLGGQVRDA
jgi:hypothetical protein